jgi:hypothetical protein
VDVPTLVRACVFWPKITAPKNSLGRENFISFFNRHVVEKV